LLIRLGLLDVPSSGLAESLAELRRGTGILARNGVTDGQLLTAAHEYMGRRLAALGQYTEALAEHGLALGMAERVLAAHPKDQAARQNVVDANVGIARAWTLAGDRERALECAGGLVRRAERDAFPQADTAQAYLSLGMVHRAFQEWAAAREAAEEALRRQPNARTQQDARALLAECQLRAASGN
jgi:tetratricopeptide (TPR) repeat protein